MFKQNVKIEYHFDLRGTIGRTWTSEDINEDTITLRQKLRKILRRYYGSLYCKKYHMKKFMIALSLMNVENEDVF